VKILILTSHAMSLIMFRGELIQTLLGDGHDVMACAPEDDEFTITYLREKSIRYYPIPLERTGMNPFKDLLYFIRMLCLIRQLKPDIVLNYTVKPVIYGSLAATLIGVPSIHSLISGLGYAFMCESFKGFIINRIVTGMYRVALQNNCKVFFLNPDDRNLFVKSRIVDEHKSVIINGSGVNIGFYPSTPVGIKPVFLMIARLLRDKGVMEYIEAARIVRGRYPQAVFQLLGPFDSNPTALSKTDLDKWQHEGIIEYLGSTDDVRPFIRNANIYVLPSYREGIPRTTLEAMSMGRPVVTTDAPGCRETVINGENGFLVPVKDSNSLAATLEKFILQPELIERMGKRSREIAIEKYDVQKVNAVIMESMGL